MCHVIGTVGACTSGQFNTLFSMLKEAKGDLLPRWLEEFGELETKLDAECTRIESSSANLAQQSASNDLKRFFENAKAFNADVAALFTVFREFSGKLEDASLKVAILSNLFGDKSVMKNANSRADFIKFGEANRDEEKIDALYGEAERLFQKLNAGALAALKKRVGPLRAAVEAIKASNDLILEKINAMVSCGTKSNDACRYIKILMTDMMVQSTFIYTDFEAMISICEDLFNFRLVFRGEVDLKYQPPWNFDRAARYRKYNNRTPSAENCASYEKLRPKFDDLLKTVL